MNYDNIPQELKNLPQWSVYKTYLDKDTHKTKKIIISPTTSKFAHCNDSTTWTDFETATTYAQKYNYVGLTFALTKDILFVDLDNAIDFDNQTISPKSQQILSQLPNTYTEKSISGKGIHILCKGNLPTDCYHRNDKDGIEIYDTNRFICMTGNLLDSQPIEISNSTILQDYSHIIPQIAYDYVGKRQPLKIYTPIKSTQSASDLITQIQNSKQSYKFNALYSGNISSYPSHSHAESALVFLLAWWTQDSNQIDNIIRSSGLMRDKWTSRRGNTTYGQQLIHQALSTVTPRKMRDSNSEM